MTILVENTFTVNNHIAISNKIKRISLYSLYFFPVIESKNLDDNYNIINDTSDITGTTRCGHKLLCFASNDYMRFDFNYHFTKSLYRVFMASSILIKNKISYLVNNDSFVYDGQSYPLLHNFSNSFYIPALKLGNIRSYFHRTLLDSLYIPIDVYVIAYLTNNGIVDMTESVIADISESYCTIDREKIDRNSVLSMLAYFLNYKTTQIVAYLLQFKHTWSCWSLSFYFIKEYPILLEKHSIYELLYHYINCTPKERNSSIIEDIHSALFIC